MKTIKNLALLIISTFALLSCEDVISPKLDDAQPILVIDAWLTNKPGSQKITITRSQPYFDNALPKGVSGANVEVKDSKGNVYFFKPSGSGEYTWIPTANETFGTIGERYQLTVTIGSETFVSETKMGRVPKVDSIQFYREEANQFMDEMFLAEFWSIDPVETGDAYWIKTYKNGELLLKPADILTAYDAGFSKGGNFSGVTFIPPIRTGINPFDEDADEQIKSPYVVGDSIYVEINAVSEAAFDFLNQVRIQTDRPGGFGELFSTPLANVSTNIKNTNPNGSPVLGFFNVGAVSGLGRKFKSLNDLRKEID